MGHMKTLIISMTESALKYFIFISKSLPKSTYFDNLKLEKKVAHGRSYRLVRTPLAQHFPYARNNAYGNTIKADILLQQIAVLFRCQWNKRKYLN